MENTNLESFPCAILGPFTIVPPNRVRVVTLTGAGTTSSNGEYIFDNMLSKYIASNENYIEETQDGWQVFDILENKFTYVLGESFSSTSVVGGSAPSPNIQKILLEG
jgi:hypothetical protein